MTDEIPRSIATGRRVALVLLVVAMVVTVLLAVVLIAADVTKPVEV
ncbi:hypothetical protein GCM10022243_61890 [Saccharothrix violaceirubra]|uniref:ABC-type arginine/histidine transport system permease subunit n=1 Tax=Saccharothrix violaceirubra TaxID=413306 RepID=A0A7W7WY82_9PSEU|nr:hypothetical protein [Saccharothrix violaceirubra]MBB4968165.1 ABC-type arginine/histidine transport system permease subunit [Saccharothrix violaceirubra]